MQRSLLVWPLILSAGCTTAADPAPPPPAPPPAPAGVWPHAYPIHVCFLWEGRPREIPVWYTPATGDTIVDGRPFREWFPDPGPYAGTRRWFIDAEPITLDGRRYTPHGARWIFGVDHLRPAGVFDGVVLFAGADVPGTPDVLYVPVSGCEFQPYRGDPRAGGVRGGAESRRRGVE
jgi:hypothetical protein